MTPRVEFEVSKVVSGFCHLSVLYADLMPTELARGILGNKVYQEHNAHLREDATRLKLQRTGPFSSQFEWYRFATGLMKRDKSGNLQSLSGNSSFEQLFQDLRHRRAMGFDGIWNKTRSRLEDYKDRFASEWVPISEHVLSRLARLANTSWSTEKIRVHFIDCLYGGFGWNDCIGVAAFPDLEVQKKFISHELSELITPQKIVARSLHREGLNPEITHTVVDMLAYFSVRDFLAKPVFPNPEKKGIKPNPNYYPSAAELFPTFERYAEDPSRYADFRALIEDMVLQLKSISSDSSAGKQIVSS